MRVAGLVAVAVAIWLGGPWTLLGALGAAALVWRVPRLTQATGDPPADFAYTLDLLRRAVKGRAAWATGFADGPIEVPPAPDGVIVPGDRHRALSFVRLAVAEGRTHIATGSSGTFVAVGDGDYGACVLLDPHAEAAPVVQELRRLIAGMRLADVETAGGEGAAMARRLASVAATSGSMQAVARAGAGFAHELVQRGTAVLVKEGDRAARIVAVAGADPRLEGLSLRTDAPAVRAIEDGVPVVSADGEDVFGAGTPERRRREREGLALPLFDGSAAVGALVIVGPGVDAAHDGINRLVAELGPRLAATRALQEAEQRANVDALTGLPNKGAFERRFLDRSEKQVSVIYVDLDHFKKLNDTHGHLAGDAALQHVARVFVSQIRDRDMVARIGGEEFGVWLPGTPLAEALVVAERIRVGVSSLGWMWSGHVWPLTVSLGVAAMPDHAKDPMDLMLLADQALYRAKAAGRDRVEKAVVTR